MAASGHWPLSAAEAYAGVRGTENCESPYEHACENFAWTVTNHVEGLGSVSSDSITTPEPASLALMATGLAGIAGIARRRRVS